jgi:DNA-binding transcriptional ArsR family regulator
MLVERRWSMEQEYPIFEMQAELCQVLGNPIRLRIVSALKSGPMCVNELVAVLKNVPQPSVSRHLGVLRAAGVLSTHRNGMESIYEITNPKIVGVCDMMRTILAERNTRQAELLHQYEV